ncbi:MAG: hypothetical protein G01um101472_286 [Parcubacteria group bacterium Gr01-1014_72]|nr:MAG: hypothetical protein G01um101472_286 [Parcubacteria group bacterium Gr01-1014_72]
MKRNLVGLCIVLIALVATSCANRGPVRVEAKSVSTAITTPPPTRPPFSPVEKAFTVEQRRWIAVYQGYVAKMAGKVGLPVTASIEEIRSHIANAVEAPPDTPLEELVHHPKVKQTLTDERKMGIITAFGLNPDSDWLHIERVLRAAARRFDELRKVVRQ